MMNRIPLLPLALFLLLPGLAAAQNSYTLRVNFVIGTVETLDEVHAPEKGWIPVMYGMELDSDTKIRTGPNSRVELSGNGNKFKISQKTSIKLGALVNSPGNSLTSLQIVTGRVFAIIRTLQKSGDRVEVLTPNAVAGVRGTEFVLGFDKGISTVQVFRGEVEFADINRSKYPVVVGADKMSVLRDPAAGPEPAVKLPFSVYQEWGVEMPPPETAKVQTASNTAGAVGQGQVPPPATNASSGKKLSNADIIAMHQNKTAATNLPAAPVSTNLSAAVMTNTAKSTQAATNVAQKTEGGEPVKKTAEPPKPRFGMNANVGPVNIDGTSYQQIVLMPDFGIGPFGIGLYLPVYFDPARNAFAPTNWYNYRDWDFTSWKDGLHDLLMKVLYVRWGQKGDAVYANLGSIYDYTLGYGFLMYRFSNMLRFPAERKIGFQFDLNSKYGGLETIVQDVFKGEIFGGRVFVHPLFFSDMKLLRKFDIGYSYLVDARPVGGAKWARTIQHWDVDAGIPLSRTKTIEVLLYSCLGGANLTLHSTNRPYLGSAFVAGVKGHLSLFKYLLEYRNLDNGYKPEYFGPSYDNLRQTNYMAMRPGFYSNNAFENQNGILGTAGLVIEKKGSFSLTYWQNLDSPVLDNDLTVIINLEKGAIPKFYGTIGFEKYNVKTFRDLYKNFLDYRTTITVVGIYSIDPAIDLGVVLKRTYDRATGAPLTSVSFETRFGLFGVQTPPTGFGI